jgi:hypothetical protein
VSQAQREVDLVLRQSARLLRRTPFEASQVLEVAHLRLLQEPVRVEQLLLQERREAVLQLVEEAVLLRLPLLVE